MHLFGRWNSAKFSREAQMNISLYDRYILRSAFSRFWCDKSPYHFTSCIEHPISTLLAYKLLLRRFNWHISYFRWLISRKQDAKSERIALEIKADRCQAVYQQSLLSQLKLRTIKPNKDRRASTEQGGCIGKVPLLLPLPLVFGVNRPSGRQKTHKKRTDSCLWTRITCHRIRIFISKLHTVPLRRESLLHPNRIPHCARSTVAINKRYHTLGITHTTPRTHTHQIYYYILFTAVLISKCDAHKR